MLFRTLHRAIELGHLMIGLIFALSATVLLIFASIKLWNGINFMQLHSVSVRVNEVLDSIAILTVALATLELSQTIIEEEVQRSVAMSAPTRVRRFLSRFMIVLVVALSIESLVSVFQFARQDPELLPNAAIVGMAAATLLVAWGLFIKLNQGVEKMEPEALERVQQEDKKVDPEAQEPQEDEEVPDNQLDVLS